MSKSVVKLELKDTFPGEIESARVVLFLRDDQGKVVGQSTKWVLGGGKKDNPTHIGSQWFNHVQFCCIKKKTVFKSEADI